MFDMKALGENIRQMRKIKGLTQEELAEKSSLSTMSVRRYESGKRIITEKALGRIADALDVGIYEFFPKGEKIDIDGFPDGVLHHPTIVPSLGEQSAEEIATDIVKRARLTMKDQDTEASVILNYVEQGYRFTGGERLIVTILHTLNEDGQNVAIARVAELSEIPRYRATSTPQSTPATQGGKDTAPDEKTPETPPEGH